jgi:hypothetical protein
MGPFFDTSSGPAPNQHEKIAERKPFRNTSTDQSSRRRRRRHTTNQSFDSTM